MLFSCPDVTPVALVRGVPPMDTLVCTRFSEGLSAAGMPLHPARHTASAADAMIEKMFFMFLLFECGYRSMFRLYLSMRPLISGSRLPLCTYEGSWPQASR